MVQINVPHWRGVALDDCSREQLLDCAKYFFNSNAPLLGPAAIYERSVSPGATLVTGNPVETA